MGDKPLRIVCADDNALIADALQQIIDLDPDMQCVGCYYNADRLLDEMDRLRPDVLVLDLKMPGRDPLDALREMTAQLPEVRTIVCSGMDDQASVRVASEAGAWGYVPKNGNVMAILQAIRNVAAGKRALPPS